MGLLPMELGFSLIWLGPEDAMLYPKMMVGRDCRKLTEREVAEYVGILKN